MQTSKCTCTSRYNEKSKFPSNAPVICIPRPLWEGEWRGFYLFKIQSPPKSPALRAKFVVKSLLNTPAQRGLIMINNGLESGDSLPTICQSSADSRPTSFVNKSLKLGRKTADYRATAGRATAVDLFVGISSADTYCQPMIAPLLALISHAPYFYSVHE